MRFRIAITLLAFAPTVAAESDDKAAAAEELFRIARDLVAAGNYAEGCPKFEAALALHASASTQLNIAKCHEHDGRLATAWAEYKRALVLNRETLGEERQRQLEAIAQAGIDALEPQLPRLTLVAKERPPGFVVKRDGSEVPLSTLGQALPVDPGDHTITAIAPGFRSFSAPAHLTPGKASVIEIVLQPEPRVAVPPPSANEPERELPMRDEPTSVPTWAWVSGGAGIVLLGAGAFFLVDDLNAIHRLRDRCDESGGRTTCDPGYDYAADNARKNRGFALFLGFSIAGAGAITASVIGITSTKRRDQAYVMPWTRSGGGGLDFGGQF